MQAYVAALQVRCNYTCQILQWRHNERDGVSNHQPHDYLLNRLFRRRSKKYQSSASLAFVTLTGEFPAQRPVKRKMFPLDDVTMIWAWYLTVRLCRYNDENTGSRFSDFQPWY